MIDIPSWVYVVDDDAKVRKALVRLLQCHGLLAESFATASAFLNAERPDAPSCLLLDVELPGIDGLQLQRQLSEGQIRIPIVFITGHGNIPMTVQAMKCGAIDFLAKPVEEEDLLRAVRQGIEQDKQNRRARCDELTIHQRAALLSPREREVLEYVVSGAINKQIGRQLGVTEKTIKVHRGHVMRKMQAGSLAELVRMAQRIGVHGVQPD